MGKNKRFQPKHRKDFKRNKGGALKIRDDGLKPKELIVFSLKYLDTAQGQTPKKWEEKEILAKAIDRIQRICSMTITDVIQQQVLKKYGKEIPKDSKFKCPKSLMGKDIEWASLRIQAKERIIGFIENDFIFHIVILDMEHEFYPSKKKNT